MKKSFLKLAGLALAAALALGIVSCANETETKIEYVEKTYCASVTFSSEDLGDDGVKVTMATTTEGAVIHYTTDGTAPAAESTAYTAPVTFTADAIIKAIAVKSGIENSPVSVAAVSIVEKTVEVDKPVEVTKYVCPKCKSEYTTAEEAANCCGVQYETVKKYVCPRDGKEYDTAEEAENCCGPIEIEKPVEVEKLVYTSELAAGTYTVYHFQQKTTGGKAVSDYVLESTESNKSVAAKSTIANLKKTYEGFTEKAMAQNETAIYVFYDRNTITYTFQTGTEGKFEDGKTEKTVSGLYGAIYTKPRAPTSGDYNFVKWQDSSETAAPSTFGAEDKTWTAVWKAKSEGGAPDYSACVVGDFILKDGTILGKDETPESDTVAAVIVRAATEEKPALGVGIVHNRSGLAWCTSSAAGYSTNIEALVGDKTSGYMDGSDGWEKLKTFCSDAAEHPGYYPAWEYCLEYASKNSLTGDLADGWYLPTVAELYTIYQNKTVVDASLSKAGGSQFGSSWYWSCCQDPSSNSNAREMSFDYGDMYDYSKYSSNVYVCSVRAFN